MAPTHDQAGHATDGDTDGVGYNPYRKYKASPGDYALVAACVLIALALLGWALLG